MTGPDSPLIRIFIEDPIKERRILYDIVLNYFKTIIQK